MVIQTDCVRWYWNTFTSEAERAQLFAVNNNSENKVKGNIMFQMGVRKGVSDLIFVGSIVVFLECKTPTGTQSKDQKNFQKTVESLGHPYFIFRSLEEFQEIVLKYK